MGRGEKKRVPVRKMKAAASRRRREKRWRMVVGARGAVVRAVGGECGPRAVVTELARTAELGICG